MAEAVDSLGVGWRGSIARWTQGAAVARLLAISPDSIWTWDVEPNDNLAPGTAARGGFVLTPGNGDVATFIPGAEILFDGSDTTAFDPDDFAERFGLERTAPLYIDLGATFRVDRIRLYPRLDSEHRALFPRAFSLATSGGLDEEGRFEVANLLERDFVPVFNFFNANPNREPVIERRFASRHVRYLRLQVRENRPWEIAEIEIYGDGTAPPGEYVSVPILAASGPRPLWGKVRYDGGDIRDLPVTVQTRSGPDREPLHYFRLTGVGADRERVSSSEYARLDSLERGPVLPNPDWSPWETVTDGLVRSPGNNPYIQFRLLLNEPGTVLRRLVIEYLSPPIADGLEAEIAPLLAEAGRPTTFVISLRTRMRVRRTDGSLLPNGDSGFSSLRIVTAARIEAIDEVLIDDRAVQFSARLDDEEGTVIRLRRTIAQDGTFAQIVLRATIFRDATRFDVQARDQRLVDGAVVAVHQSARAADVDPLSLGGSLVVRLAATAGRLPLVKDVRASRAVFTPNGDGANDAFRLSYALLKLTRPAPAYLDIALLDGRLVRRLDGGLQLGGEQTYVWDGRDASGRLVAPGLYLYRLHIAADGGSVRRQGVVGVVY